jgi:hypothetical protein
MMTDCLIVIWSGYKQNNVILAMSTLTFVEYMLKAVSWISVVAGKYVSVTLDPGGLAQLLTYTSYIWDVPGLCLDQDTSYPD